MTDEQVERAVADREHLRLLEIFFYVSGGAKLVFALFPLMYVVMGAAVAGALSQMPTSPSEPSPAVFGLIMAGFGLLVSTALAGLGAAQVFAGRCIRKRRRRGVCFVIAAIGCLAIPWGIALGVFTFIVLSRESVGRLFASDRLKEGGA